MITRKCGITANQTDSNTFSYKFELEVSFSIYLKQNGIVKRHVRLTLSKIRKLDMSTKLRQETKHDINSSAVALLGVVSHIQRVGKIQQGSLLLTWQFLSLKLGTKFIAEMVAVTVQEIVEIARPFFYQL